MRTNYVCVVVIFLMLGRFVFHFFSTGRESWCINKPENQNQKENIC
jgi:hypothetical protein